MEIELLLKEVRKYQTNEADIENICKAYELAKQKHGSMVRKSGEPYLVHPLHTAIILAELRQDTPVIIAGLLHDVIEDTAVTKEDIYRVFGDEVAFLVDGVTKLNLPKEIENDLKIAQNTQKLFLQCAKDIRVILVKLADRLHNMRTLGYLKESKRTENAEETLSVYVPLAHMLGLRKIKSELEDLAFRWAREDMYFEIKEKIMEEEHASQHLIENTSQIILNQFSVEDTFGCIKKDDSFNPYIELRTKTVYGVYQRLYSLSSKINLNNIHSVHDLHAIKVIVKDIQDCYLANGKIHSLFPYVQERNKDYIGQPKTNGYQSLHTILRLEKNALLQVQTKTEEMNLVSNLGLPYYYHLKGIDVNEGFKRSFIFSKIIKEAGTHTKDAIHFYKKVKKDALSEKIYIYYGDEVIGIYKGADIYYLAFMMENADGDLMKECTINGQVVNPSSKLEMGDVVTFKLKEKPISPIKIFPQKIMKI